MVLVAVSGLQKSEIDSAITKSFSSVTLSSRNNKIRDRRAVEGVPDYIGSQMGIRDDTFHEAQIAVGYETFSADHEHYFTLKIFEALIGEWNINDISGKFSSPGIAETFALEKLADNYTTFNYNYRKTGTFGIYFSTHNRQKLDDTLYEVFNEYQKLFARISAHDLYRAKQKVLNSYLKSIASPAGIANDIGYQLSTYSRRIQPSEVVSRIDKVTVEDIKNLIDIYFYDVDPVVIGHGPLYEFPDYVLVRSWTYWNRW